MAIVTGPIARSVGRPWVSAAPRHSQYTVSGTTRDSLGAPLGGCTVEIFETVSNAFRGGTVSDASGNYSIEITGDRTIALFAVAYLAGLPDLQGTTVNTLIAT